MFKIKACRILRDDEYLQYVAVTQDAAQRRYWTLYETVKTESVISSLLKEAEELGFVAMGMSRCERPMFFDRFRKWIAAGKQADMHWLGRHMDLRENPDKLLKDCRTVISLAYPYPSTQPLTSDGFCFARYTEPEKADYHNRLKGLARKLVKTLLALQPGCKTRICVDSAPILERSFAHGSGIGFIGKNNTFIIPGYGSYIFLAEILTTAELFQHETQPMENLCGECNRCISACPTGALESPYTLNASKCLSYLTIEHRGKIKSSAGRNMGNCFFGCDVCQEVCPYNEGNSVDTVRLPSTDEWLAMEESEFETRFGETALSRAGLNKIKSNIKTIRSIR